MEFDGTPAPASPTWQPGSDLDIRLRRTMLAAAGDRGVLQDQIDSAEIALAGGLRDVAEMLYGLIFLQTGFSAPAQAMQREVIARTGLWAGLEPTDAVEATQGFSVDLAISELQQLMRLRPVLASPSDDIVAVLPTDLLKPVEPRPEARERLIALCERVSAGLRSVPRLAQNRGLAQLLAGLSEEVMTLRPIRLHEHLGLDTKKFAALFALDRTRQFLLATHDLVHALPHGSTLFDQASRLDPAALGPYFANLRFVIRDARDIFALIEVAGDRPAADEVERWCIFLSGFLTHGQTLDLVDELGDRGMRRALYTLLARIARSSAVEQPRDIVWRIRDAGIDIGDWKLGVDAQTLVVLWTPTDVTERLVLGDLRAGAGDVAGAETAYSQALILEPGGHDAKDRLAGLRDNRAAVPRHGFGTTPGRLRLRRARLAAFAAAEQQVA